MKALIFKTTKSKLDNDVINKYGLKINDKNTIIDDENDPAMNTYYYEKEYLPKNIGCLETDLLNLVIDFNQILLNRTFEKNYLSIEIVDDYLG